MAPKNCVKGEKPREVVSKKLYTSTVTRLRRQYADVLAAWMNGRLCDCGEYTYDYNCHDCGLAYGEVDEDA